MRDINFFSIYKRKKGKNNGFRVFIIVFLSIFVLFNVLLGAGYLVYSNLLNTQIKELDTLINSNETRAKIAEANRLKTEAALTAEYLKLLQNSTGKLQQMDQIDTALMDKVRQLTPLTTQFTFAEYNGNLVNLECTSPQITDAMDMYHAFLNDPAFATVTLSGIVVDATGNIVFSIYCQLAGGEAE